MRPVHPPRPRPPGVLLLAAVLGLLAPAAPAEQTVPSLDRINFQRFTPQDGLPPAVVYCGMEDSRGFLWFGTADGVARFDGHRFRVFRTDPADPESLPNSAILAIQEDAQGDLWMATEGGLALWHRDTERFSRFQHDPTDPASLGDNTTQSLVIDRDGALWVGTTRGGLHRFDPRTGKFERFPPHAGRDDSVNDPWVRCLFFDRQGVLWIGTGDGGLNRFDPATRRFRFYTHDPADPRSLPHNRVSAITEDAAGNLWIGTDGGLCRLGPDRAEFERLPEAAYAPAALPNRTVTALITGSGGELGIGTDGGGFTRYDPATRTFTPHRHSRYASNTLLSDKVRALFQDQRGDLWLGHFPAGLSHFDHSSAAFKVVASVPGDPNTMSDDHVLAFHEDPSGDLWVGTDNGGLNHWSAATQRWRSYTHDPDNPSSLGAKAAVSLLRDHQGRLWVGTWDGGLNRFEPASGTFVRYLPRREQAQAISDRHVWHLAEDHEHRLWIATIGGGLERYDPVTDGFVHHRHDPADPRSLNDDIVSALYVARDGTLWAGTPKGLGRWNPATQDWDRFQAEACRPHNHWIFDILESRDGSIWVTAEGGGLHRLDPRTGTWTIIDRKDGMPSDAMRGLLEDDDGMIWIGTSHGLVRFHPQTRQIRVFDEHNGLPGSQFNPQARFRLASGDFLFGTTQGFIRFNPRAIKTDPPPAKIVLTSFEAFNEIVPPARPGSPLQRSITETSTLTIPARLSVISFEFAALGFPSPSPDQYRFMLEGFDHDWRKPGRELRATFTNLDPGRYRLRVKAANRDGVWNETGSTLDLIVIPPWWRTWWFQGGASVLVLLGASALGWRVSAQRLLARTHERELAQERLRAEERAHAAEALRVLNQELEQRVADRTAHLDAAVKELETFSYSVSHDLRTPLRAIDGFSRVLLEDYADRLDADGKDSLQRICAGSQRMGQLIDDMLVLSRVSRDELRRGPVDLSGLATLVADTLRQTHPQRRIDFVITPGLEATGDARLLRILLENLFDNACKFSSRRPLARIEFGRTTHAGERAFFVRDNGAGFDRAAARKLFGPFQRFHTSKEFPGTGIGLATVQRIIHRHGGWVEAESQPDRGATFFFTLSGSTPRAL